VSTTTRTTSAPGTLTTATSSATLTTVSAPTTAPTTSTPPSSGEGGTQAIYQQCGGINWKGATACAEGSSCHKYNPYYSQCIAA
jgi:hypothetical protein